MKGQKNNAKLTRQSRWEGRKFTRISLNDESLSGSFLMAVFHTSHTWREISAVSERNFRQFEEHKQYGRVLSASLWFVFPSLVRTTGFTRIWKIVQTWN